MPGSRPSRVASSRTASSSRSDALPVGAAKAMSGGVAPRATACWSSNPNSRATVVVLPVPGPPAMTETRRRTAVAAANGCRWSGSSASGSSSRNNVARPARSSARSTSITWLPARLSSSAATCRSSSQRRFRYRFDPDSQSGLPCPTSGLWLSASSHVAGSGQGSASRSVGRSMSLLAVWRIVRRSTHTWPSRGARAAKAIPRRDGVVLRPRRVAPSGARRGRQRCRGAPPRLKARKLPDAPAANEPS